MSEEDAPAPEPGTPDEPLDERSRLERAAGIARTVLRHKQLLVAAMEMLRAKAALSEDEEVKILAAYEQGSLAARSALNDLVERLQKANLGRVVVALSGEGASPEPTVAELREGAAPTLRAAGEQVLAEARPYLEHAKARLAELRALEEPVLQRLESISANLRDAGKEVAGGLKGAGREAADELVRRGKRWWMSAETEELEREFFDWALRSLPKAERTLVHVLIGFGILLFASGILLAAQELNILQELAIFVAIALLLALGLMMINWGIKISEAMKTGRGEVERLARMNPQERRVFLATRWTERAKREGIMDEAEARLVIEETIHAEAGPRAPPSAGPAPPTEGPQLPQAP